MRYDVPFRLLGGAQPLAVLPVRLNGTGPFQFVLDTGASRPVLTPKLARMLDLEIDETKEATGAGGRMQVDLARVESFMVGEALRRDVPVIVTGEIERISTAVGASLDGVIGYELLRHFCLVIDYSRLVLGLEDGSCAHADVNSSCKAELPLRLAHAAKPLIMVPAFVNGTGPYPFALDTGASATVIDEDLITRLGLRTTSAAALTGGGGAIPASMAVVQSLAVEAAEVTDLPVAVAGFLGALSQAIGTELLGIIGYNYLQAFRVTIDYRGAILRLE